MPFIKANDINIFYNIMGTGDKTAVLVHGAGSTSRLWALQVRALVKAGYRVLTYDVRGHGATDSAEGLYSIELFAEDLNGLLEALGIDEKVYVCGLSMGGLIVQIFARRYPQKVKAAILSNTYSWLGYEYLSSRLDISIDELKKTRVTKEFLHGILSRRKSENWELSETIEQASQALLENEWARNLFFEDQLYITSEEQRIKIQSATGSFDSRSEVKNIKCPTLVIGSDNDIIAFVEHSHYLHEQISGSELVILKSSNHVPCLDRYEEFNKLIIDFFNDNN